MAQLNVSGSSEQRQERDTRQGDRNGRVGDERDHVKGREREDGKQRAASEPFELLAL